MNGQPKPAFYVVVGAVVLGLVTFAISRSDLVAPKAKPQTMAPIDAKELATKAEHPDADPGLMVKEYKLRPRGERLPDPPGAGAYTPLEKTGNTVRFAVNVWAGSNCCPQTT